MEQIIIHVDMDAFYASVEVRDNLSLKGKPVIIGSMPDERGVVSTCSYEAREYGVHSAMNIKEAYRLCPDGVYIHPDFEKYRKVSEQLHELWSSYATAAEYIALDEAYLDVTETAGTFERAREFAHSIKKRTMDEIGLSCSVGLSYCKAAAKTASEEMKPNGYYEIPTPQDFMNLMMDRDVRALYSVGPRTAEKLYEMDIHTVRDMTDRKADVIRLLGSHGRILVDLAEGRDDRPVVTYRPEEAKSISRELTFQENVSDPVLIKDVLLLLSMSVEERARRHGLHGSGVSLKITYADMRTFTRSRLSRSCEDAMSIQREAAAMFDSLKRQPVRLIGVGLYNLSDKSIHQMTIDEFLGIDIEDSGLEDELRRMQKRYRFDFIRNIDKIYRLDFLHRIVEHMRIQRAKTEMRRWIG